MASAHDLLRALSQGDRLTFLATINKRVWEVVGGGPAGLHVHESVGASHLSRVALNPQPLPPVAAGYELSLVLGREVIASPPGESRAFLELLDDWCGTGWPRRWPFPEPSPFPWKRSLVDYQLGGAIGFGRLAAHYEGGEMQELFDGAAGNLLEAALR